MTVAAQKYVKNAPSLANFEQGDTPSARLRLPPRGALFALAVGVFVFSTWIAYTQDPRPDPFAPESTAAIWDFWRYPAERNAFHRLPVVTGNLNTIFALADGKKIWAVGDAGLIVYSADGGANAKANTQAGRFAPKSSRGEMPGAQSSQRAAKPSKPSPPKPAQPAPPALPEIAAPSNLQDIFFSDSMSS